MPEPKPPRTPPGTPPLVERAANRLMAELELDTDRIARQMMEGDLHVDAAHIPPEELGDFLSQLWVTKPDQAVAMADNMESEEFFQQVLDHLTTLSPQVKADFMTMLRGGLPYEDAVKYAQQMHDAELLARQQFLPLAMHLPLEEPRPPVSPPLSPAPGPPAFPGPALAPPPPPMPGGPPPLPPGIPAMPSLAQMAPMPPGTLPPPPPGVI